MFAQEWVKHPRTMVFAGLTAFALGMNGSAAQMAAPEAAPEAAGEPAPWPDLSAAQITDDFSPEGIAALEAAIAGFVEDGHVKGAAGLLVKDGEVISYAQSGLRNVVTGAPITQDTIYRIYSMTKPITGVALMMLWEDGAFSLDDPITKHIPEFKDLQVMTSYDDEGTVKLEPVERPATMRELMSHTAGFAYGLRGQDPANQAFRDEQILRSPDMETLIEKVAGVPLLFQPGEQWYYSVAVDIQGYLVEKFSGMSFGAFLDERLFTPLGMTDTGFYVPEEDLDRLSQVFSYVEARGGLVPMPQPRFSWRKETRPFESGGGGLASTMSDYARFCQMLVDGGIYQDTRLLKEETVDLMRTDVLDDLNVTIGGTLNQTAADAIGFGLDFGVLRRADPENNIPAGLYFWGGAAGTWFWIDPVNDLFYIGMIQRFAAEAGGASYRDDTVALVYEALQSEDTTE